MAKITLAGFNPPGDPFGGDKPVTVEIPDSRPTAYDPYALVQDPNDYLSYRKSAPVQKLFDSGEDYFGFGNSAPSAAERDIKINFPEKPFFPEPVGMPIGGTGRVSKSDPSVDRFKLVKTTSSIFDEVGLGDVVEDDSFTKGATGDFSKFQQFTKVKETDDGNIEVWGIATHEKPDLDGEICDYNSAKDAFRKWSAASVTRTSAAGQQISLGPIRHQHSTKPAGKATKVEYKDDDKEIWLGSVPIDDETRQQLQNGFLTGYSIGGSYSWRECEDCGKSLGTQQANNYCSGCNKQSHVRFGLKGLSEVSYVDSPCTGQGFDYVRSDGSTKFVAFSKSRDRPSSPGVAVLSRERIYRNLFKLTMMVDGRKRTVLAWPDKGLGDGSPNYLIA